MSIGKALDELAERIAMANQDGLSVHFSLTPDGIPMPRRLGFALRREMIGAADFSGVFEL